MNIAKKIPQLFPSTSRWVLLGLIFVLAFAGAPAISKAQGKRAEASSDRLDLKQLEDKYWSAKDRDFAVVQNRTYIKEKRFFLNAGYGVLMNDPYSNGRVTNWALGYYFSEQWGIELAQETGSLIDNASVSAFVNQNASKPNYNKLNNYTSLNALFVPFYAKMSMLDRAIVYFDIQFALGVGSMKYTSIIDPAQGPDRSGQALGYNFDFTQQLYFSRHWAIRMDLKNKWSSQNVYRWRIPGGDSESNRALPNVQQQDTTLLFGVTFLF
ncbi:MAG: outer membrane beta-barrel domain-containing protein [Bdellovibrio sp.]